MNSFFEKKWTQFINGIILKDFGWTKGIGKFNNEQIFQWRDPDSGHWYSEKTALKLVKIQALDHLDYH